MKKRNYYLLISGFIGMICAISVILLPNASEPKKFVTVDQDIAIKPDFTGVTVPPNIAPLNFVVLEPGREHFVKIHSANGNR